ncbi:unnamed protein product [Dicrocoelium dendriticum]|nr:unnamed protein product [Dicrocoelium dendriticum]
MSTIRHDQPSKGGWLVLYFRIDPKCALIDDHVSTVHDSIWFRSRLISPPCLVYAKDITLWGEINTPNGITVLQTDRLRHTRAQSKIYCDSMWTNVVCCTHGTTWCTPTNSSIRIFKYLARNT